jgi:UDP-N-acetylglucosamine 2-epimerase (non-hydrolysing)
MIDSLQKHKALAGKSKVLERLGLKRRNRNERYALLTLHRPSNVDDPAVLKGILEAITDLSKKIHVVFPAHPRTIKRIRSLGLEKIVHFMKALPARGAIKNDQNLITVPPLGYLDFLRLMSRASLVLTDSGGIQEETTILGIPCLTLRDNTERPITVKAGTNILVGNDPDRIMRTASRVLRSQSFLPKRPRYWDGKAARRIVTILKARLL